jgi:L-ascorbate metabolism protein UlaG (beta-lactamase superfamily)
MCIETGDAGGQDDGRVYLRPEVKIEPLACGWYAWTHLMSPAQRAMNIVFRHIPLLKSFIQTPAVHISASQDPTLFGGPFVDLPIEMVPDVSSLLEETYSRCGRLIELAREIKELDARLLAQARGASMNELYACIPAALSGLVEFLYDVNNRPKLRFYEELLHDEYFDSGSYEVMLSVIKDRDRTFFMSTPRIPKPSSFVFRVPLTDSRIDRLAAMRNYAAPWGELAQGFAVPQHRLGEFRSLFTDAAPARNAPDYFGSGIRIRYFGHACVLIQTAEHSILLDPLFAWEPEGDGRFHHSDLPDKIDTVVISHGHQDHCVPEVLIQLRHRIGRVVVPENNSGSLADPSLRLLLGNLGIKNVIVANAFGQIEVPQGAIMTLPFPGEHAELEIYSRQAIAVEIRGRRFVFLVDSEGCDPMLFRRVARRIGGRIDALFIGMECSGAPLTWLYGPLLNKTISRRDDESRRLSSLDSRRARNVLTELSPASVYVYAMGQEPWLRHMLGLEYTSESVQLKEVSALLEHCREMGIPAESLFMSRELEFQ